MRRISNQAYQGITDAHKELENKLAQLSELTETISSKIALVIEQTETEEGHNLATLLDSIEETRCDLFNRINEEAGNAECYYDERSERWQESYNGENYKEWKDALIEAAEQYDSDRELYEFHIHSDEISQGVLSIESALVEKNELPNQSPNDE
ncbi:hypothetical protein [Vibrio alginolyticus]|uniref:hypothetical protein n=1 Tax=Vibrio alginolyticus TaxID=663 RepID=UPI0015F6F45B|nr:hypothetical protein [Vibrio alginolyticus]